MNFLAVFLLVASAMAENWATYPSVPKTATINGFSDPIKSLLPECASLCADFSTGNTPCPYWDTGCLCVMPQWSGQVAACIVESCSASDVALATALAYSLCSKVGANVWMMPASLSTALSSAADGVILELSVTQTVGAQGTSIAIDTTSITSQAETSSVASTTLAASASSIDSTLSGPSSNIQGSSTANGSLKKTTGVIGVLVAAAFIIVN